ncbi:hypothetical protein CDA63_05030 [Hymenobacter amundsenii]|uniref:DUF3455 domain-containing protein n=1 Tax=Hymenobacter amundsenii TaxID=2006685 RepID=A0A246FMV8_9BACT|nr:hypothetical protein [Hymenobacter amundsenii]OWP64096.1 hypothetical protein CDA63_05030 [Hymenobacter amundsenii]
MKQLLLVPLLISLLAGCQPGSDAAQSSPITATAPSAMPGPAQPTQSAASPDTVSASPQLLALTSNALQLVSQPTGSTREIPFGMPQRELMAIIGKVLQAEPKSVGINTECGAGPLKMASWSNGLTLVFQQNKARAAREWQFVGWYAGAASGATPKVATMAGVGIGSTRAELEGAYVIKVFESTLGQEFSTTSGLYGLLDGPGKEAVITSLWSGTSCNFR